MTEMKRLSACALGMVLFHLSLVSTEASTESRSFRGSTETQVAALPRVSLSTPVNSSNPNDWEPSREDVLSVYPSKFIVDWDVVPTIYVAESMYEYCGTVATTTCEVGEDYITCWCMKAGVEFNFGSLGAISQQDLNTPIEASGPEPNAVPTMDDVLQVYSLNFLVDWTQGHNGTKAAGILFNACGMVLTSCMLKETGLKCLCNNFESPVFLGYETLSTVLPRASLSIPVNSSDPEFGPSMEEVLKVYPSYFVVSWDRIPETEISSFVYKCCGIVDRTTCKVRETDVACWCPASNTATGLWFLRKIPEQDLNTPVHASGPDPDAVPTVEDVEKVYPHWNFLVDWTAGHNGTMAAVILFDSCGMVPTSCIVEETRLECLCNDFATPIFLGYETLRSPNALSTALAAALPDSEST
jgi:uncharacterized protein Veg